MTRGYYPYVCLSFPIEFDPFKKQLALPDTPLPKLKSELIIRFPGRTRDRTAKLTANLLHLSDEEKNAIPQLDHPIEFSPKFMLRQDAKYDMIINPYHPHQ